MKSSMLILLFLNSVICKSQIGFIKNITESVSSSETCVYIIENNDLSLTLFGYSIYKIPNQNLPLDSGYVSTMIINKLSSNGIILLDTLISKSDSLSITPLSVYTKNNSNYSAGIVDQPTFISNNSFNTYLNKIDENLNTNWFNIYTTGQYNSRGTGLVYHNGYMYLSGTGDSSYNPLFIKVDTNGNTLFAKSYNAPFMYGKMTKGMLQINDSTFILAGDGNLSIGAKDKWMLVVNNNGDSVFSKILTQNGAGWVTDIAPAYNQSYFLLGNSISRYSYLGDSVSEWILNQIGVAYSIAKTNDSNYIVGGEKFNDFSLTKLDTFGNIIWSHTYGYLNNLDKLSKAIPLKDGGYVMCGVTQKSTPGINNTDILVIKVDSMGELHFATTINLTEQETELIALYPNPTANFINIKSDKIIERIQLFSIAGQLIQEIVKPNTSQIDLSELAIGPYIIQVNTKSKMYKQKVLKQ